jgi:hypothetical protein
MTPIEFPEDDSFNLDWKSQTHKNGMEIGLLVVKWLSNTVSNIKNKHIIKTTNQN